MQGWLLLLLASTARAGPCAKAAFAGCVFLASVTALPPKLWRPQLQRLGFVCGTLALFTLLGAGVAPDSSQQQQLISRLQRH